MPLSDLYRQKKKSVLDATGYSPTLRIGGLSERYGKSAEDPSQSLDARIGNATTRLQEQGVPTPEAHSNKGLFQKLLEALNYLNNKKNQALYMATHGTNVWDTPEQVTGTELLRDWTGKETFWGDHAAGFLFDAATDPLNALSFGTAGAVTQAAKGTGLAARFGAKALNAGDEIAQLTGDAAKAKEIALGEIQLGRDQIGSAGKIPPRPDTKNFLDRLMESPDGERLRSVQGAAEQEMKRLGVDDLPTRSRLEEEYAQKIYGTSVGDLENKVYKESYMHEPVQAPQLPIDEVAPKPWKTLQYSKQGMVEEVSVDWLSQIKGNALRHDDVKMKALEDDIAQNGFKEPILIMVGQQDRKVILGEGNHRLEVARRLGYKYVPVRVMRQQHVIKGEELAGEAMTKVPKDGYFPGDAPPSRVFDNVPVKPASAADELASAQQALPAPEDFTRPSAPGAIPPGTIGAAAQGSGQWFAQLGGHIPFTDIGGYAKIPGSEAVLGTLGKGAKAVVGGVGSILGKIPGAIAFGEKAKQILGKTFIPGYGVAGEVNQLTQRTAELIRMDNKDIVDNLVTMRKGWEEMGYTPAKPGTQGADDLDIIKALEDPTHYENLRPDQQEITKTVRDFFDVHYKKAMDEGVIEDFTANYLPHIFKGNLAEINTALESMRRSGVRIKTTMMQPGTTPVGGILDMPLTEILNNAELAGKLKPETDLIKMMALYKSSLEKAIRNKDMLTELTALGPDIIRKQTFEYYNPGTGKWEDVQAQIPVGWVKAPVTQLKNHWVPPEIANHLKDVMEPFINDLTFKQMMKLYDGVLGWWKGMATVPNIGFQIRNQMGNMFNNYIAGVRSLDHYMLAREVQRADDTTMDSFYDLTRYLTERNAPPSDYGLPSTYVERNPGVPGIGNNKEFDVTLMDRIFNDNRYRAKFFEGDGPKVEVIWNGRKEMANVTALKFFAKYHAVTGAGYYGSDLGEEVLKKLAPVTTAQKYNPLSTNNALFRGFDVNIGGTPHTIGLEPAGHYLEDNARIAHFVAKLKENGGNMEKAAESVKKYLFDYSRLTPVEKNFFKRLMPFYAFTRNNLPLQLKELVKQPKYASMMATFQNATDQFAEEATGVGLSHDDLPKFMNQLYSIRLPFQVGAEGRDVVFGLDMPNRDINNLNPKEIMSMLTPLMTVPFEMVANRNLYTGRDLQAYDGETVRAPGYIQGLFQSMQFMSPDDPEANLVNKFFSWMPGTTVATNEDGTPELRISPHASQLLNQIVFLKNVGKAVDFASGDATDPFGVSSMLTGASAVSSTEAQRQTNSKYNQLQALEDLLRKMKDEGSPVPTLSEIQKQDPGYRLKQLLGGR